jgi:2,5-furandicarboxylate decarboxylase 1
MKAHCASKWFSKLAEQDISAFISKLEEGGELERISSNIDPRFQAAAVMKSRDPGKAILFLSVGSGGRKVVANLFGERKRIAIGLGIEKTKIHRHVLRAISEPTKCVEVSDSELLGEGAERGAKRISDLPILTHYEKDAGPYITSAAVIARDPDTKVQNASIHRLLLRGDHLVIRMVEGRHLHQIFEKHRARAYGDMPVAIVVAPHPAVTVAAASPAPAGVDELEVAGTLMGEPLKVIRLPSTGLRVPADAQYAIEGLVSVERMESEWMTDILGTYDIPREQPVVKITGIRCRDDPIYHALLPAGSEHKQLMGLPFEARILEGVERVGPKVVDLSLMPGSGGWLHAAISIRKRSEGDGRNAILAALAANPSLKGVIVLDEDIDPSDYAAIDFSVATRFQGKGNVVVVEGARGSSLDPSADQRTLTTSKWGLDTTLGLTADREKFRMARIPWKGLGLNSGALG